MLLTEGDLPTEGGITFAVDPNNLVWTQLLPCMIMPLAPAREGRINASIACGVEPTFLHEDSKDIARSAALIYGSFVIEHPSHVLVLHHVR